MGETLPEQETTPPSDLWRGDLCENKCFTFKFLLFCIPNSGVNREPPQYILESQVLKFGPDFLPVEPDGVLLPHALRGIETSADETHDKAVQQPGQELTQDLRPVRKLAGWDSACKQDEPIQNIRNTNCN